MEGFVLINTVIMCAMLPASRGTILLPWQQTGVMHKCHAGWPGISGPSSFCQIFIIHCLTGSSPKR